MDPAHAPVPRTAAERIAFRQLYQTLVEVTCDGRVEPVVASSWRSADKGREWTFSLRADVRGWEGAPLTADDVASSWLAAQEARAEGSMNGVLTGNSTHGVAPRFASLRIVDPQTLRVELVEPAAIGFFAHPALAVRRPPIASGWPDGSGPYRPLEDGQATEGPLRSLSLLSRTGGARVDFRSVAGDARNALDAGVDLLVTRDAAVIDYAAASDAFLVVPFAWDRGYVLVVAAGGLPRDAGDTGRGVAHTDTTAALTDRMPGDAAGRPGLWRMVSPPEEALAALARDAVRVEARPFTAPGDPGTCGVASAGEARTVRPGRPAGADQRRDSLGPRPASGDSARPAAARDMAHRYRTGERPSQRGVGRGVQGAARIVYPAEDVVARALAERLVALSLDAERHEAAWLAESAPALAQTDGRASAAGLAGRAFANALRAGKDAAYLLPVERRAGAGLCETMAAVVDRMAWLDRSGPVAAQDLQASVIVPLVETRSTLIARRGVGGVAVDGRGTLVLQALRRASPGAEPSGSRP